MIEDLFQCVGAVAHQGFQLAYGLKGMPKPQVEMEAVNTARVKDRQGKSQSQTDSYSVAWLTSVEDRLPARSARSRLATRVKQKRDRWWKFWS
jgi:hypothetical protein